MPCLKIQLSIICCLIGIKFSEKERNIDEYKYEKVDSGRSGRSGQSGQSGQRCQLRQL